MPTSKAKARPVEIERDCFGYKIKLKSPFKAKIDSSVRSREFSFHSLHKLSNQTSETHCFKTRQAFGQGF